MYDNFENLQKKCKKYQFKQRVKFILPLLFLVILISVYLLFSQTKQTVKEVIIAKEVQPIINVVKVQEIPTTKEVIKEIPKVQETPKVVEEQENITQIEDIPYALQIDKKYQFIQRRDSSKPKSVVSNNAKVTYIERPKQLSISVKKIDSVDEMIAVYNSENEYHLALKIANSFYDSGDYDKSLLWAKKANILNREDEASWILYAKSEYAKGNQKRAITILDLYLANSKSSNAESLLVTWTQGNK